MTRLSTRLLAATFVVAGLSVPAMAQDLDGWTSYIGGDGTETVSDVVVTGLGFFVTGWTDRAFAESSDVALAGSTDVFVAHYLPSGELNYVRYLGGSSLDRAHELTIDANGDLWVVGETFSADFPVGDGSLQPYRGNGDAFLVKLDGRTGAVRWGTFFGGTEQDGGNALTMTLDGVAIVGDTRSDDLTQVHEIGSGFAETGAFASLHTDAFVVRYNFDVANSEPPWIDFMSYVGGLGNDKATAIHAVTPGDDLVVAGTTASTNFPTLNAYDSTYAGTTNPDGRGRSFDCFLLRVDRDNGLEWSTYIGGPGFDDGVALAPDRFGNFLIAGQAGTDFPTTANVLQPSKAGEFDAFVSCFNANGNLAWSTFLGGTDRDVAHDLIELANEDLAVVGFTASTDLPGQGGPLQRGIAGGFDGFVSLISSDGTTLRSSSTLGGSGADTLVSIALWGENLVVAGETSSDDLPTFGDFRLTAPGGDDQDGLLARIDLDGLSPVSGATRTEVRGELRLDWDSPSDSTDRIEVQRRAGAGIFTTLTTLGGDATTYLDTAFGSVTNPVYRIVSWDALGGRADAIVVAPVEGEPGDGGNGGDAVPPAPARVAAAFDGGGGVLVTWSDDSDDEVGYEILRAVDGGRPVVIGTVRRNVTRFVDQDPVFDADLVYSVRALGADSTSATTTASVLRADVDADLIVDARRGNARNRVRERGDTLVIAGRVGRVDGLTPLLFDPDEHVFSITMGPLAQPITLVIPANDTGWRVKRRVARWSSSRSDEFGRRFRVRLDLRTGKFRVTLSRFDFAAPLGNPFTVTLGLGEVVGTDVMLWRGRKQGRLFIGK